MEGEEFMSRDSMRNAVVSVVVVCFVLLITILNVSLSYIFDSMSWVLISSLTSVILGVNVQPIIIEKIDNSEWLRKKYDREAKYEGYWYHDLKIFNDGEDLRGFGLLHFKYDRDNKKYIFTGSDYNENGKFVCSLQFEDIKVKNEGEGFTYHGTVVREGVEFKNPGNFVITAPGLGNGNFANVDITSGKIIKGEYKGYQLKVSDISELLDIPIKKVKKKKFIVKGDDFVKLAEKYNEKHNKD